MLFMAVPVSSRSARTMSSLRKQNPVSSVALSGTDASELLSRAGGPSTEDEFAAVLEHLRRVHPVQLAALVDGLDTVVVRDVAPVRDQNSALALVALVDELYDAELTFGMTGCAVAAVFEAGYRHGGYRKKYGRCESRQAAMLGEAFARLSSA